MRVAEHQQEIDFQRRMVEEGQQNAMAAHIEITRIQGIQNRTLTIRHKCTEDRTRWESTHAFLSHGAPESSTCPVCWADYSDRDPECMRVALVCGHSVCHSCYRAIKVSPTAPVSCPTCRCPVRNDEELLVTSMAAQQQPKHGSKLVLVLEVLRQLYNTGERVVIFTQWADQAKFLETRLKEAHTICFALDGPGHHRCRTLRSFHETEASSLVCLVDDVDGINLQCAAHVCFVHPVNPEVENRCLASVCRLGQKREVHVHRFIAQGTPEEAAWGGAMKP